MVSAVLGLCTLSRCRYRCPEISTSSIDWAQLSRFYLKTDIESSLRNVVLKNKQGCVLDKDMTMDNVQKHNICTNVPSSQTFSPYYYFGEYLWLNSRKYSIVRGVGQRVEGGQASGSSSGTRAMDKHVRRTENLRRVLRRVFGNITRNYRLTE
jgi:hypothetical protein